MSTKLPKPDETVAAFSVDLSKLPGTDLPRPTHNPYAIQGPQTVYRIELDDPSLTIAPPGPLRRKGLC